MRLYIGVIGRYQKAARLPVVIARNGSCRKKSPPNVTEWVFTGGADLTHLARLVLDSYQRAAPRPSSELGARVE
jgi:hypothetical protein